MLNSKTDQEVQEVEKSYVHEIHKIQADRIKSLKSCPDYVNINDIANMIAETIGLTRQLILKDKSIELSTIGRSVVAKNIDVEKWISKYNRDKQDIEKQKLQKGIDKEKNRVQAEKDREIKRIDTEKKRISKEQDRVQKEKDRELKRIERDKTRQENEKKRIEKMRAEESKRHDRYKELAKKYSDNKEYQDLLKNFESTMLYR